MSDNKDLSVIRGRRKNIPDASYVFILNGGDASHITEQFNFLVSMGIDVKRNKDNYPALSSEEDFQKALELIWKRRIPGWWSFHKSFLKYKICSENEFHIAYD